MSSESQQGGIEAKPLLSIVVPVYNERSTIATVLEKVSAVFLDRDISKEIVIVDDGSTDGTREFLSDLSDPETRVVLHSENRGKGAAVRTALDFVRGEYVLIQDADLEYDPKDYPALLDPVQRDRSIPVVFGSRFLGHIEDMKFPNFVANKLLTFATNLLYGSRLTDLCTGFKLYKTSLIQDIPLVRNGFDLEHELTAKLLRRGFDILEVPVDYRGRDVRAGKKVRWTDFFKDIYTLLHFRVG